MQLLKNKILWGLVISLVGVVLGYMFSHSYQFGICYSNLETQTFAAMCRYDASITGIKLFYPSLALTFVFLVLLFVPRAVSVWRRFAVWYIPVVGFIIAFSSPSTAAWKIGPDYHQYIQFFSVVYIISSLVAVLGSGWASKMNKKIPWYFSATALALALVAFGYMSVIGFFYFISR